MQQFDRHKIVFLHQEADSQSAISLKTGTSQYSVQRVLCGPKIKAGNREPREQYLKAISLRNKEENPNMQLQNRCQYLCRRSAESVCSYL